MPVSQLNKKILIVEDDAILSSTLAENLALAGFGVVTADDGEKGLALALSAKPDLILLDILLPKMDGLTILEKLQENENGKNIPVIVLTNLGSPETISKAISSTKELKEFLVKVDWRLEDVITKVKERLGS